MSLPPLSLRQLALRAQGELIAEIELRASAPQSYLCHTTLHLPSRNTQPLTSCKEHTSLCIVRNRNNEKKSRNTLLEEKKAVSKAQLPET